MDAAAGDEDGGAGVRGGGWVGQAAVGWRGLSMGCVPNLLPFSKQ